jgi:hypothetical protein
MTEGYRGVVGAFPYAFRRSGSLLFKLYVVVSALAALFVSLLVGLGLVVLIANTAGVGGGSLTLSRSFYVVVGLFLVAPMLAPTLFVARRHRRGKARQDRYDVALAFAGFLFLFSLYVGLVITVPPAQQEPVSGALAPVVAFLYALPAAFGLVPPLLAAAVILLAHRVLR